MTYFRHAKTKGAKDYVLAPFSNKPLQSISLTPEYLSPHGRIHRLNECCGPALVEYALLNTHRNLSRFQTLPINGYVCPEARAISDEQRISVKDERPQPAKA
jgi:hypothetical protein